MPPDAVFQFSNSPVRNSSVFLTLNSSRSDVFCSEHCLCILSVKSTRSVHNTQNKYYGITYIQSFTFSYQSQLVRVFANCTVEIYYDLQQILDQVWESVNWHGSYTDDQFQWWFQYKHSLPL